MDFFEGAVDDDDVVVLFLDPICPKPRRPMPIPSLSSSLALRWCWFLFMLGPPALDDDGESGTGDAIDGPSRGVAALLVASLVLLVGKVSSASGS